MVDLAVIVAEAKADICLVTLCIFSNLEALGGYLLGVRSHLLWNCNVLAYFLFLTLVVHIYVNVGQLRGWLPIQVAESLPPLGFF